VLAPLIAALFGIAKYTGLVSDSVNIPPLVSNLPNEPVEVDEPLILL